MTCQPSRPVPAAPATGRPVGSARRHAAAALAAVAVLGAAAGLAAQDLPEVACPRAAVPPVIDGRGDDAVWAVAPVVRLVDVRSFDGVEHPHATEARLAWDATALYVLFTAHDPDVWSGLTERDDPLYDEEVVEVFIDPDGDGRNYVEIEINSLNTVFDLQVTRALRDGGSGHPEWSPAGLRSAVHVAGTLNTPGDTDTAWSTEIALPWAALLEGPLDVIEAAALPPIPGETWRVNLYRYERPRNSRGVESNVVEYSAWSPVGRIDFHAPDRFGVVRFVDGGTAVAPSPWARVKTGGEAGR